MAGTRVTLVDCPALAVWRQLLNCKPGPQREIDSAFAGLWIGKGTGYPRWGAVRVQDGFTLPRAARMGARVAQREQASRGLCRGGRDFFLRALVVENDDNENEFYRDDLIFMIFHQNLASF